MDAIKSLNAVTEKANQILRQLVPVGAELSRIGEVLKNIGNGSENANHSETEDDVLPVASKKRRNAAPAVAATSASAEGSTSKPSLKKVIWDILVKAGKKGCSISDIKNAIEKDGLRDSTSETISTQLSTQLQNLRKEGMIERAERGHYCVIEGKTLVVAKRGRRPKTAA